MVKRVRVKVENEKGRWIDKRVVVDVPNGTDDRQVMEAASRQMDDWVNRSPRRRIIAIDVNW